ncbi:glycosyltransferase family 4 protein [Carnobacterium maltaromaticum]|uniref:glycosyltransferase family 4 protein n=1 Tax=Carnobacterium maltaromaticum TaxID=2751 RepID=UPI00026C8CF7|nr:glycosyltransferase family 4 protein [Carnobacterium maltaromaticum]
MKKILIVSQYFYPDNFKINEISVDLIKAGYSVDVITGLPDYPSGIIPNKYKKFKNRNEEYHKVNVERISTFARKKGSVNRALNYFSFAFNGYIRACFSKKKYDYVLVYQVSPVTMIIPAMKFAKNSNANLIVYCLDIWPECVKAMGIKEDNSIYKYIHKMSKYLYSKANTVIVSSKSFLEYLNVENKVAKDKLIYLPQHADDMLSDEFDTEFLLNVNNKKKLVFTGNIGKVQDVETIIKAVGISEKKELFEVYIVGEGSELDNCKKMVKDKNLENYIFFHGRQPYFRMKQYYQQADACLLTLKNENKIGLTIPAKLQTYLSAGKPIIAAIDGDSKLIIEEAQCGFCVTASDYQALSKVFDKFSEKDSINKKFGENARKYYESKFTRENFMNELLSILDRK